MERLAGRRSSGWCAVLCGLCLLAPRVYGQAGKVIILDHADSLFGKIIEGEEARELIGNVRFRQENVHVTCDRALQFVRTGEVLLTGRVVVAADSLTMRSPRGLYHRDERSAEAFDGVRLDDGKAVLTAYYGQYLTGSQVAFFRSNVVVRDSVSTISADSLTYYRAEKRYVASGEVQVHSVRDNAIITGNRLDHYAQSEYSRMSLNPIMIQFERTSAGTVDTLVVRSRMMEVYRDSARRMVATDSAEFIRDDIAGVAGVVTFYTTGDSILMRRSPILWYRDTQVSGDSININLLRRKLSRVHVTGNALAASVSDSQFVNRFDQLSGEDLHLGFGEQVLKTIEVNSRASSVYHLYEDSVANGLNMSSGDRITVTFASGKVQDITVVGGVEGRYVPENLVQGRETEFALPGFVWKENRPRIRKSDFPYEYVYARDHD